MDKVITGQFETVNAARTALEALEQRGFQPENISYIERETASDAATRATLGGATGMLLGLVALAIPGVGPVIAAGPIAAALAGGAAGAAGGLLGSLLHVGMTEAQAKRWMETAGTGGTFILVHATEDKAPEAAEVLRQHGATGVTSYRSTEDVKQAVEPQDEFANYGSNGGSSQWGQRVLRPDGTVADRTASRDAGTVPGTENPHRD